MTCDEFSNEFDTLLNSYRRFVNFDNRQPIDTIQFDEYEKSLFLTQAQEALVIGLYNGTINSQSFEADEEQKSYLKDLIKFWETTPLVNTLKGVTPYSKFAELPTDVWFIIQEQVEFEDSTLGCKDNSTGIVKPTTHDIVYQINRNPFKGPNDRRVLKLSLQANIVELISKYNIKNYNIRYLVKPTPIILVDLGENGLNIDGIYQKTECKLNSSLHRAILEKAVNIARSSWGADSPNIV